MKPESEWFRPPRHKRCCSQGDVENWLWIAEPELGEGIYGVAYAISDQLRAVIGESICEVVHVAALGQLHARIAEGKKWAQAEGSLWQDFIWVPVIKTHEDGTTTVLEAK